ncbi:MAG: hypothetical protein D6775_08920 [Caldilineae bacterium]|nr:MAG: hypothetical protein D6775_08920 [Caldilineae bacterium]
MNGISRLIIATAAIVGTFVVVLIHGARENERMALYDANFRGRDIEVGADIYYQACAECHGENGEGLVGPALNAADLLVPEPGQTKPPRLLERGWKGDLRSFLEATITSGRVGTAMPAWGQTAGGPLRPDQISSVASFIMNWGLDPGKKWGGAPRRVAIGGVEPAPAVGQELLGEAPPRDVRSAALGRYLFEGPAGCGSCHAFNGTTGTVGPDLTNVVAEKGRDYVRDSIVNPDRTASAGHAPGAMPDVFEFVLTDIEIESIIDYLETPEAGGESLIGVGGETPQPAGELDGQEVAQGAGCLACHSVDGSTLVGPTWQGLFGSTREFEDGSTAVADETYLHQSIVDPSAHIVKGFSDLMPKNFGDMLSEDEINAIIEYIKTLQ